MTRSKIILGLIVFLAFLIRIIGLGSIPTGFTPDEASQGYSAYSLLQTGKDEWGTSYPISSFKSFLDYKAPLQTYLMIPSIAIFGLNEFAVRLPSAIFGTLAIIAIYFLSQKIFQSSKFLVPSSKSNQELTTNNQQLPLIAALLLAISPWHIQFSRTALEVNLLSFLFPMGLYFFLKYINPEPRTNNHELITPLMFTSLFWGLGLYAYHAGKIFIPLFILGLIFLCAQELKKQIKKIMFPALFFLILISPIAYDSIFGHASRRGSDLMVTNLSTENKDEIYKSVAYANYRTPGFFVEKILHNKYTFAADKFIENYFSYLSPTFWFTEGGRETTYSVIPGRGLLYLWQLPFVLVAVFNLIKSKEKNIKVLLLWLFIAAVPAAITKEGYRPNRAGSYALLFEIITAYGFWKIFFETKIYQKWLVPTLAIISISRFFYLEDYASAANTKYPTAMSYGWREAVTEINKHNEYPIVRVERGSQSQSFVGFYGKVPPVVFQSSTKIWSEQLKNSDASYLDQLGEYSLGKYTFKDFSWPEDKNDLTLYLSHRLNNLPADRRTLHIVKDNNDKPIIEIFDFRNEK